MSKQEELDNFMASIKEDGAPAFSAFDSKTDETVKETPSESPTEAKTDEKEPPQGGENTPDEKTLPFHKHPRWIAQQAESEALKAKLSELEQFQQEVMPKLASLEQKKDSTIPQWWTELYGQEDLSKRIYEGYSKDVSQMRESIKQEVISEMQAVQHKEKEAISQWEKYIETNVADLKERGFAFDKNELLKIVDDYSPKDAQGNYLGGFISFDKAYEILQLQKNASKDVKKDTARKVIAAQTSSDNQGESKPNELNKIGSMARKGWYDWQDS